MHRYMYYHFDLPGLASTPRNGDIMVITRRRRAHFAIVIALRENKFINKKQIQIFLISNGWPAI